MWRLHITYGVDCLNYPTRQWSVYSAEIIPVRGLGLLKKQVSQIFSLFSDKHVQGPYSAPRKLRSACCIGHSPSLDPSTSSNALHLTYLCLR